jgi:MFS family permease
MPRMARVALAFVAFNVAEWATWVAMLVYAYGHGGAVASSAVAVIQLVPAALFAPIGATLADRYPRTRMLTIAYFAQAITMSATAVALQLDAPIPLVYGLAACAATSITLTRPAQNGLLPSLAKAPGALTRVNATLSTIENASIVAGPALAGVMLATAGAGFVFAVMAAWLAVGAVLVAGIRAPSAAAQPTPASVDGPLGALRMLLTAPGAALLIALLTAQQLQVGALDVLFVALALSALHIGETGVGLLTSAVGLGGVIGAIAAGSIVARGSLPRWMVVGSLVWGVALMLVAPLPQTATVFALVIIAGAGRGLMDVAGRTLLQHAAPPAILSRAFGVLEGLTMAALAIGAALAAFLVERFGPAGAVAVIGALLPLVVLATARSLRRLDARDETSTSATSVEGARARRRG